MREDFISEQPRAVFLFCCLVSESLVMTLDASPPVGEYLYTVEQIEWKKTYFLTQSLGTVQSSEMPGVEPVLDWAEGSFSWENVQEVCIKQVKGQLPH